MKIPPRDADTFVRRPDPACVAVLVYGPDAGLVGERVSALVGAGADPFSGPVELAAAAVKSDPAVLADEAAALSFGGGSRVVRVRGATDSVADEVGGFLESAAPGGLVVVESGDLGPRSPLRRLFESAANAAAIPCYTDDEAGLRRIVTDSLAARGITPDADAVDYLVQNLGSDRAVTRAELEKLSLYVGESTRVTVADAKVCVGDCVAMSLDAVASAAAGGEPEALDRSLRRAVAEGVTAVGVLRAVARYFLRLHLALGYVAAGQTSEQAMDALRPKVFFKQRETFRRHLNMWSEERVGVALDILTEAELDCKTTGMPEDVICGRALLRIAQAAARGP